MSRRFVISWVEIPGRAEILRSDVKGVPAARLGDAVHTTLAKAQSDLILEEMRVASLPDGRSRVELEVTLTTADVGLERIQEWVAEQLNKQPLAEPLALVISEPKAKVE